MPYSFPNSELLDNSYDLFGIDYSTTKVEFYNLIRMRFDKH